MSAPCANCERRGCGSYHDQCEEYKKYIEERVNISRARALSAFKRTKTKNKYAKTSEHSPTKCHKR